VGLREHRGDPISPGSRQGAEDKDVTMLARLPRDLLRGDLVEHLLDLSLALAQLLIEQVEPGHEQEGMGHVRLGDAR
jgi:hypothetical protein